MNPMQMMKLGERLKLFQSQHPRVLAFVKEVKEHALAEGSVIEVKVSDPAGREYVTNLRVTAEDMETVRMVDGKD